MSKGEKLLAKLEEVLKQINQYELETEALVTDYNGIVDEASKALQECDLKAKEMAKAKAEAEETARVAAETAETKAEEKFIAELNNRDFVSDASGRIGCLLTSDTDVEAGDEVESIMSTLSTFFPAHLKPENFNGVYSTLTKGGKNRFFFTLFLNLKKGKSEISSRTKLHLVRFAGKDGIKYYLSHME